MDSAAAAEILRGLLDRLNQGQGELARRLLITKKDFQDLRDGHGVGDWLPRLRVLEKVALVEADWRLVPVAHSGFAVAVRRGQDIVHFEPDGTFSHWALALPGTGHRLELKGSEGTALLVDADGTTEPADIRTGDRGDLRVSQADGEWRVDGAERVVRGYERSPDAPDPARLLVDWSRGRPALDGWERSLNTIKETNRLVTQQDVARLLGLHRNQLAQLTQSKGFQWRVLVAAFLTSQNIGNWSIETIPGFASSFHVVFPGSTLHFQDWKVVAWKVSLPGADLRVHSYESGQPRLKTLDGRQPPPGWELRVEDDGGVTVSQAAAGEPRWRVSAQRILDSFTLPPADPTSPSAFRRLTDAGVLSPAPRREAEPMDATATVPDTDDLPVGSSSAPQMPGTAAAGQHGPQLPPPHRRHRPHPDPAHPEHTPRKRPRHRAAPPAGHSTDPFGMDIDLTGFDPGWLDTPSPGRPGTSALAAVGDSDSGGGPAGPDSRGLPDSGSGDRVTALSGEGTADGVPGPSEPDRSAPPPAAGMPDPDADKAAAAEILQALLGRLNHSPSELARRLSTSEAHVQYLRDGRGAARWLPRLRVLEKVAPVEADWRLVSAVHGGFAVAVRRGQDIAHFEPDGTVSHWALALPGTGHRLELKGSEGTALLVDADGTTEPADIRTGDRGELRVSQADGEWWVDGAERVVRGYRRSPDAPDPARLLSDWSRGRPALDGWERSLNTIKETHRLSQADVAKLLGVSRSHLPRMLSDPNSSAPWRVLVAAYLTIQNIRYWSIETIQGSRAFDVVFGAGTTLRFWEGEIVAWMVSLPGTGLRVHYDQRGRPRLETPDGERPPPGWKLRIEGDGGVTVSQFAAAGGPGRPGPQWRLSAERTLDFFTLPPAGPADPSAFRRLTDAGALAPAPRREAEPMEVTATAPDTDVPMGSSSAPPMPGTAAEGDAGPSHLHLTDTAGHTQPLPTLSAPPASDPTTAAPPAGHSTDPFGMDIDLTGFDPGWLDTPSPGRPGTSALAAVGDSGGDPAGPFSRGLPDSGFGDPVPGPLGEGTADGVPGQLQPDRPVPPPATDIPNAGRAAAAEIIRGLLGRLENHTSELARRLSTSEAHVHYLRDGGGVRGNWLPRLRVLEKVAPVEADWRLVSAVHGGFAVAVRRGQDIAHFDPRGTFSHWAMTLPGTGHRLAFEGPEGTARLLKADGTAEPADISTDDRGDLHVSQAGGEWWVDGAERVVRRYQQRAPHAPDPARLLSEWSRDPGEPALDNWQDLLNTVRQTLGLSDHGLARLLGFNKRVFTGLATEPPVGSGIKWRLRVAAYLASQNIGNWSIETIQGSRAFDVVFGAGTTLRFRDGEIVAWMVSLPGAGLRVHYDRLGTPHLETSDGRRPPQGWELRVEGDGGVTVSQLVAGGSQWRVSAERTLKSFTLPPADPAHPSAFRRLSDAGVLLPNVPGGVPGPSEPDRPAPPRPAAGLPDAHRAAADGAERVVGDYRRAPDPARLLSDWVGNPGEPALDNWQDLLKTVKETRGLSDDDVARLLGITRKTFTGLATEPPAGSGITWRLRVAAYLTSQDIGNWRIETIRGSRAFDVVFDTGTTLRFRDGEIVAWMVSLPGAGLRVHYDRLGTPHLEASDGRRPPQGWELRVEGDGGVTVSQAAAGGPQWRVSAERTLDSVPADPAHSSPFRRLSDAGALPPAPRPEPEPVDATATAPDADLPVGSSSAPLMPGTAAEGSAGPSYLDTVTWSAT